MLPQPVAFLITPLSAQTAGDEDPAVYAEVQTAIAAAAERVGVALIRADDIFEAGVVIDQVRTGIEAAEVVIAVCTGKNANVFYELGLAEILTHKPILVAPSAAHLPFDKAHWRAQMYEGQLDSLAERVEKAIRATLSARQVEAASAKPVPVLVPPDFRSPTAAPGEDRPASTAVSDVDPLALVEVGNFVNFKENTKRLVRHVADVHTEIVQANQHLQPTRDLLNDLAPQRFEAIRSLVAWVEPVVEYKPEWLGAVLHLVEGWFREKSDAGSGYTVWVDFHTSWVYLFLQSVTAIAIGTQSWDALRTTLDLQGGWEDGSPLMLDPSFTFPNGLGGNSESAFEEFVSFLTAAEVADRLAVPGVAAEELACGANLALCLARVIHEDDPEVDASDPYLYAAFAQYWCKRIRWAARLFATQERAGRALGAATSDELNRIAEKWWPKIIRRTQGFPSTCDSWSSAKSVRD